MPGKKQAPRQLRLVNVGELDDGAENPEDGDVADESWESIMKDIARMTVRLGFRPTSVPESEEAMHELSA